MELKLATDIEGERSKSILEAEEHIRAAAQLLRPLGVSYNRIAWILEDTLSCIAEAEEGEELDEIIDFPDITANSKSQNN